MASGQIRMTPDTMRERAGHFVSLLSVIGGWGGVLPPHLGQKKSRRPFQISCSVVPPVGGWYSVLKVRVRVAR